jgi:hypothetical protein
MFVKSKALLIVAALSASLVIGLFAAGCGGGGDDKSDSPAKVATTESNDNHDANPPKSEPDTDAFKEIAVKSCIDSAVGSDVSRDMATEYCNCAIDKMLENMTSEQIADIALSGDSELPPDVEEQLMNAVLDCIDKLMQ